MRGLPGSKGIHRRSSHVCAGSQPTGDAIRNLLDLWQGLLERCALLDTTDDLLLS